MTTPSNVQILPRRYTWRLYPTAEQAEVLHEQRRMCAELWNALLQRHEDIYRRTRGQRGVEHSRSDGAEHPLMTYGRKEMSREITELLRECPEWCALSTWTPRMVADTLDKAFRAFFRRAKAGAGAASGYPRYKSRARGEHIPHWHNLPPGVRTGTGGGCRLVPTRGDSMLARQGRAWTLAVKGVAGPIAACGHLPTTSVPPRACNGDIIWRDDRWWFSIAFQIDCRRQSGIHDVRIAFDGIDGLAYVDGVLETPDDLIAARIVEDEVDVLKSARDRRWPRPAKADPGWRAAQDQIDQLIGRARRKRQHALHVWTARLVARAARLDVTYPELINEISTPRGDQAEWGAAIAAVSNLNRTALSYGIGYAVSMLKYKAEEAGICCDVQQRSSAIGALSQQLVSTERTLRSASRKLKKETQSD